MPCSSAAPRGRETAGRQRRMPRNDPGATRRTRPSPRSRTAMTCVASSRSALYQVGLMLRTAMSMPCASMSAIRRSRADHREPEAASRGRGRRRGSGAEQFAGLRDNAVRVHIDGSNSPARSRPADDASSGLRIARPPRRPRTRQRPAGCAARLRNARRSIRRRVRFHHGTRRNATEARRVRYRRGPASIFRCATARQSFRKSA